MTLLLRNTTSPTSPHDYPIRGIIQDASNIVTIVMSLLAVIENVVIVVVLYRHPVFHTTSNKLVANVAASNFFTSTVGIALHSFMTLKRPLLYDVTGFGLIDKFLRRLCVGVATCTMSLVAVDGWMRVDVRIPR